MTASNDTYVRDLLFSWFCIILLCFWFDYITPTEKKNGTI